MPSGILRHTEETNLNKVKAGTVGSVLGQRDRGWWRPKGWVKPSLGEESVRNASWRGRRMHEQGSGRWREAALWRGETFLPSSIRCRAERSRVTQLNLNGTTTSIPVEAAVCS